MFVNVGLVTRIVDGDTFDASVDLGYDVHRRVRYRIKGYDAPERYEPGGSAAMDRLSAVVLGQKVTLRCEHYDKYGRSVASVTLPDGRDLVAVLNEPV